MDGWDWDLRAGWGIEHLMVLKSGVYKQNLDQWYKTMILELSDVDRPFPFYCLLLNTWHGVSPKWRYQKHLKLWPIYVSFVASNGKECAFLIVPIISLGHYPFLFTQNLLTSSCLNLEKILFCFVFKRFSNKENEAISLEHGEHTDMIFVTSSTSSVKLYPLG